MKDRVKWVTSGVESTAYMATSCCGWQEKKRHVCPWAVFFVAYVVYVPCPQMMGWRARDAEQRAKTLADDNVQLRWGQECIFARH